MRFQCQDSFLQLQLSHKIFKQVVAFSKLHGGQVIGQLFNLCATGFIACKFHQSGLYLCCMHGLFYLCSFRLFAQTYCYSLLQPVSLSSTVWLYQFCNNLMIKQLILAEIRERDWCNVVTCHMDTTKAYVWRLQNYVLGEHILTPSADNQTPVKVCFDIFLESAFTCFLL